MKNYIQSINGIMTEELGKIPGMILYGENITTGSCISGMTKGLVISGNGKIINVGNCENTQAGVGFGLMMSGVSNIMFSKQLEFILLSMDHFVNTHAFANCQRQKEKFGSFAVVTIICDQGLQGPQSSYNALSEICSAAKCPGFVINTLPEARHIFSTQLNQPGFKIICLSQRLWPTEGLEMPLLNFQPDGSWFQYTDGEDVTILCFNAALSYGKRLKEALDSAHKKAALFTVNFSVEYDLTVIHRSIRKTGRVVLMDDSKSTCSHAERIGFIIQQMHPTAKVKILNREKMLPTGVNPDVFEFDVDCIVNGLKS